jgi:hypothetical protein
MYIKSTSEAHSCNYFYRGKAIIIKYSDCVFVAIGIQHAKRVSVRFYSIFSHYLIIGTTFEKKILNVKCVFHFLYKFV